MEALEPRLLLNGDYVGLSSPQDVTVGDTPDAITLEAVTVAVDSPVYVGQGLYSYAVRLISNDDLANAFEFRFAGPMNQVWKGSTSP